MIKRIMAMIIAVIIPISLLSGCGKSLTVEEYKTEIEKCWKGFLTSISSLSADMQYFEKNEVLEDSNKFENDCKNFENALKDFEKINPPSEYKEKHKQMIKALDNERYWLTTVRKYVSATTPEEIKAAEEKVEDAASYENSLPHQCFQIILELNKEIDDD